MSATETADAAATDGARPARTGCALVTGGSRGIGAATAHALAAAGWPVGIAFRSDEAAAERVVADLRAASVSATALQADISAPGAADHVLERVRAELGPVLVLVNCAGICADALAPQLGDDEWDSVVDTNLSAAFRLTRGVLRGMLRARFGRVINVASVSGLRASPGQANYSAAKAGLIGMTRTVAAEVARRGITVNAVAPGFVDTDMTAGLLDGVVDRIPARRAGTADEVAACIRFLASEEASYVTGATLVVDGGLSA